MVSPFHDLATQIHMSVWGERDAAGNDGVRIIPREGGPGFVIPVVIDRGPKVEVIEGHQVDNPAPSASFREADWLRHVAGRDPGEGDVIITPDRKRWDIGPAAIGNDGIFSVMMYVFRPR